MLVDPQDAAAIQAVCAVGVLSTVVIGVIASWGSMRTSIKSLQDAQKSNVDTLKTNMEEHSQLWAVIRNHEGRLGTLEGRSGGHHRP